MRGEAAPPFRPSGFGSYCGATFSIKYGARINVAYRLICDILPAVANGGDRGERTLNPGLTFRHGRIGKRPFSDDRQRGANVPNRTAVPLWPLADGYAAASADR